MGVASLVPCGVAAGREITPPTPRSRGDVVAARKAGDLTAGRPRTAGRRQMGLSRSKGQNMLTIGRTLLGVVLLALLATPFGCISNNNGSDEKPRTETKVGGDKGVVVEHGGGQGAAVHIGGDKGVNVEH